MTTAKATSISHSIKPKRRKYREITISSPATHGCSTKTNPDRQNRKPDSPIVVPTDKNSSTCSSSEPDSVQDTTQMPFSPGNQSPAMGSVPSPTVINGHYSPREPSSSFNKFNNALTAGLLNPMSPPPDPTRINSARSSPTLGEMMANEPEIQPRMTSQATNNANVVFRNSHLQNGNGNIRQLTHLSVLDKQALTLRRINEILENRSPGNQFNDSLSSDVKLTLSSKDGVSVSMDVHRQVLVDHSRYFAVKLSDRWAKQQRLSIPYMIEIADCDDVEVYVETVRLMYSEDLRRKLMKRDVIRVLGILKVSAAIGFDDAVLSCLEYLEAAPWTEDEEEKVASLLSELNLEGVGVEEVLKRVSVEDTHGTKENGNNEEVLINLLNAVLEGKDEKARREMKGLVSKLLHENSSHNDLGKESLYSACDKCLQLFRFHFLRAASGNLKDVVQIARQADNLHWILDILIDRQVAEDFLQRWASMSVLSEAHPKVPAVHRYEISRVTARLFVGLGKGQMLASKELRFLLLQTWLVPFYDDFGWVKRASEGLDRHLIEECLSNTILTLPLDWQQEILVAWFNRFLNSGDDCPNIQRAFEVWWRRAFWRRSVEPERTRALTITTTTIDDS